jgi:uncharacterized membrane protein
LLWPFDAPLVNCKRNNWNWRAQDRFGLKLSIFFYIFVCIFMAYIKKRKSWVSKKNNSSTQTVSVKQDRSNINSTTTRSFMCTNFIQSLSVIFVSKPVCRVKPGKLGAQNFTDEEKVSVPLNSTKQTQLFS